VIFVSQREFVNFLLQKTGPLSTLGENLHLHACRSYFLPLLMAVTCTVYGQSLHQPLALGYHSLNAYSKNKTDVFTTVFNQASLAHIKDISAGLYSERRFLLNDLSVYEFAVMVPTASGNFGFNVNYSGSVVANNSRLGLAYGRSLGSKVDVGVQFDYAAMHIQGYGNASALNVEIGALIHFTEKLHAGLHAKNFTGGKMGKNGEEMNTIYTAGFGYDVSDQFLIATIIEKEEGFPVNIHAGFEYRFHPRLNIRAGIASATSIIYAGAGIKWKMMRMDILCSYHPNLGITPGLGFLINFKRKEN
jgi:hypothetical protein